MSWLTVVLMLTYLDRLAEPQASPEEFIQDEFSFTTQTMGWSFQRIHSGLFHFSNSRRLGC